MRTERYADRREAGRILGELLKERFAQSACLVVALSRGGVPVGLEVARALDAPLDVLVCRKLGMPGDPELAMGAITVDGVEVLNQALIARLGITPFQVAAAADHEAEELHRCEELYREGRRPAAYRDRPVIVVDDGLATGATMRAAICAIRQQSPAELVVAVPVGAADTCDEIAREVDDLICPFRPEPFFAVASGYDDFSPITDENVCEWLVAAAHQHAS